MTDNSVKKILRAFGEYKHVCVGLDTDIRKIPNFLLKYSDPVFEFNKAIIEATKNEAAAYKINLAFYEKDGSKGFDSLQKTVELIPDNILTIGDAKRGDIGNTSQMYAKSLFEHFNFDSVTLNPFMGFDSLQPFLTYENKINFILALTSNPGAQDFEKLKLVSGKYLFQEVIEKVNSWNTSKNCGIVFGATNIKELSKNINSFNDLLILLPGVGTQGGSLEEVVNVFHENHNERFLINVSRALLYADSSSFFADVSNKTIRDYNSIIKTLSQD